MSGEAAMSPQSHLKRFGMGWDWMGVSSHRVVFWTERGGVAERLTLGATPARPPNRQSLTCICLAIPAPQASIGLPLGRVLFPRPGGCPDRMPRDRTGAFHAAQSPRACRRKKMEEG